MIMMVIAAMEDDDDKAFYDEFIYRIIMVSCERPFTILLMMRINTEDLINDTFIKIIEKISLIRTLDSCKTAVYVVYTSRSVAINFIKHRDVQKKHTFYGGDMDLAEKVPSLEDTIEDRIIHQEEIKEMGNAILRLPGSRKICCILNTCWK